MSDYAQEYARSINTPEAFWSEQADRLNWMRRPQSICEKDEHGIDRWFADGELNTSALCLDDQVAQGRGNQVAIFYDSPVTDTKQKITYAQLLEEVSRFASVLRAKGVEKGDRVLIYMPMIPQAAIAMLAVARLGAVHSVVFGGFAANELAVRIDDAEPKVLVTASCGVEVDRLIEYKPLVDEALHLAQHNVDSCLIFQRPQCQASLQEGRDYDWEQLSARAKPVDPVPVKATDPLYILYTSGTTGKPKGVVRDNGGHAVAMRYSMTAVYDMQPGDVFWAASDVGWVVGHSYIVYAPLMSGLSSVLYEGKPVKTPDAGAFWRVVEAYKVKALFSAPTAFRAIKKEDPKAELIKRYDTSSLQAVFVAGERLDPPTLDWIKQTTHLPVVDHWWQTETGWAICGNPMGIEPLPVKAGSSTKPSPGFDVRILDEKGNELGPNQQGNIAIKLPLPPACMPTIWKDHQRFEQGYLADFPGYYCSGDGGYKDEDGYVFIMGRTDDVINIAGHRFSTGEMEELVASHTSVAECAVIGIACEMKGQIPLAFVLLKDGVTQTETELQADLVALLREKVGAVACFKTVLVMPRLPKTRSGKILRKLMRQIVDGEDYSLPSTIDDPTSVADISAAISRRDIGAKAEV
jgi:propionyl-CoA synthetase